MKTLLISLALFLLFLGACNSPSNQKEKGKTSFQDHPTAKKAINENSASNPIMIKEVMKNYLDLKNALVKDDDKAAAQAGKQLISALKHINQASLPPAQVKVFAEIADDAKEHAEHISTNAGNIKHQREHFEMLSADIYDLVKAGDKSIGKLYYNHCPMYNNGKGAYWISETKDIQNPYLGKGMPNCGDIKEEIN